MVLVQRGSAGADARARLAQVAAHASDLRVAIILATIASFCALTLAVTLYRVTRDVDADIARFAMLCRVGEGINGAPYLLALMALLWLATTPDGPLPDAATLTTLTTKVMTWNTNAGATLFAAGSTGFCYLLLRGRLIPVTLAWIGVVVVVVLGTRTIVYAISPSPLALELSQQAGGPALPAVAVVAVLLAVGFSAVVIWLAALGVRERRLVETRAVIAEPRLRLGLLVTRALGLWLGTMPALF